MAVIDNCLFYQGLNQSYAWQGVLQSKGNSKIAIKGVLDAGRIRWPNPHIGFVGNWEDTVHQGQSAWRDVSQYNNSTWTLHHLLSHRALFFGSPGGCWRFFVARPRALCWCLRHGQGRRWGMWEATGRGLGDTNVPSPGCNLMRFYYTPENQHGTGKSINLPNPDFGVPC